MNPFFSVIIPTLNEERFLPFLLNSLVKQNFRDFEVILVDSVSSDKTVFEAKKFIKKLPFFNIIVKKTKNVSSSRNLGAQKARGEFLVFFDADVEAGDNFFSLMKKQILENNVEVATVWNRPKKEAGLSGKIAFSLLNFAMTTFQKIKPGANGACIIIKKTLFEKIGGFDEEVVFGEDFQLLQKAARVKARFKVFSRPILYVSTRRFDKEGLLPSFYKSTIALFYQVLFGPIKKPLFTYKMGGDYFK